MSIASQVKEKIAQFPAGSILNYTDFADLGNFQAVALNLSRLSKTGGLRRLSKGQYYVAQKTQFGLLMPSEGQIIDKLLQQTGGYIAGFSALNDIGVSSQIPSEITILGSRSNRTRRVGALRIKFIVGGSKDAQPEESALTNILETLRLFKSIPNGSIDVTLQRLKTSLQRLSAREISRLTTLSQPYRPSVRALLGALLQNLQLPQWKKLKKDLNPMTAYTFGVSDAQLPNRSFWRIR